MTNPKSPFEQYVASLKEDEDPTATNRIRAARDIHQLFELAKAVVQTAMNLTPEDKVPYQAIREVYREIHYLYESYESNDDVTMDPEFASDEEE
jgi:hypothetical protein